MANITVTYSFTNATTADASQVNTNFTDIINGTSDGTKDFSINALTCAGTATFNGNVAIGNASSDDLTVTASLASTLPIKTNTSFDIGSSTKGLANLYMGGSSTFTAKLVAATLSASRIYTIPEVSADASFVMTQGTQTIAGVKTFSGQLIGKGTTTNDDASAGNIGEYALDTQTATNYPSSGTFGDLCDSGALQPGDWEANVKIQSQRNGATITDNDVGVSTSPGNSTTGLTYGVTRFQYQPPTAACHSSFSFKARISLAATATVYLKYSAGFSAGTPQAAGSLEMRRIR